MKRARIFVSGRVQGVFFRHNTRTKARELGLLGFVRNLEDGRVEAVFEGEDDKVKEMADWMAKGPDFAKVEKIQITWEDYKNEFDNFEIKR